MYSLRSDLLVYIIFCSYSIIDLEAESWTSIVIGWFMITVISLIICEYYTISWFICSIFIHKTATSMQRTIRNPPISFKIHECFPSNFTSFVLLSTNDISYSNRISLSSSYSSFLELGMTKEESDWLYLKLEIVSKANLFPKFLLLFN